MVAIVALVQSLLNNKPRSRHLKTRRRVMYDEIMVNKNADIAYLQTSEMTTDVLTKVKTSMWCSVFQVCSEYPGDVHRFSSHKKNKCPHHPTKTGVRCILSSMMCTCMRPILSA